MRFNEIMRPIREVMKGRVEVLVMISCHYFSLLWRDRVAMRGITWVRIEL